MFCWMAIGIGYSLGTSQTSVKKIGRLNTARFFRLNFSWQGIRFINLKKTRKRMLHILVFDCWDRLHCLRIVFELGSGKVVCGKQSAYTSIDDVHFKVTGPVTWQYQVKLFYRGLVMVRISGVLIQIPIFNPNLHRNKKTIIRRCPRSFRCPRMKHQ